ncbi:accessory gene regulator B family protein [Enterococcus columbae]|nr:accessory gene regulator B family protein [Enterococcus columbae]EOT44553.1 hypothetical protein OMW_00609 [Enterococcus columbae DSM 7374 = ATCC 51263]OJG25208.1 hypothetical protein RR47_GL001996 [Enterococcus columbae DSM 7374 = ATCC 51263]
MKILEFFTQKLIRKLIKYQLISDQDVNLYSYGINLLLSYLLNLFTILLIGLLENKFIETIFFTAIFVFIRSYSGGLHFSKFIYCYIGTVIVISLFIQIYKFSIPITILNTIFFLISFILFIINPMDNKNRKFDSIEKKVFSKKSKRNIILVSIFYLLCLHLTFFQVTYIIFLASLFNLINILLAKSISKYNIKIFL